MNGVLVVRLAINPMAYCNSALLAFCGIGLGLCTVVGWAKPATPAHLTPQTRDSVAMVKDRSERMATWRQFSGSSLVVEFYYQWGNLLHQQEDLRIAAQAYQKALDLNPYHPPTLINQGLTWIELGKAQPAIQNFQTILHLPDATISGVSLHTLAYYNLAIIHKRRGAMDDALQSVRSALRITPNFQRGQQLLQQLLQAQPGQGQLSR